MATERPIAPAPVAEVLIPHVEKALVDTKTANLAQEEPLPFDPATLRDKYLAKRDKLLARSQGVEQYVSLDGSLTH